VPLARGFSQTEARQQVTEKPISRDFSSLVACAGADFPAIDSSVAFGGLFSLVLLDAFFPPGDAGLQWP